MSAAGSVRSKLRASSAFAIRSTVAYAGRVTECASTLSIIDATAGRVIWANRYDGTLTEATLYSGLPDEMHASVRFDYRW